MEDERLADLAQSIKANGIIQPIVARTDCRRADVRSSPANGAGAPRRRAGLAKVPVVVKDVDGDDKQRRLELALDREPPARGSESDRGSAGLSARSSHEFGMTQEQIAAQVGKDRIVGRQHAAVASPSRRSARGGRVRPALDGSRAGDRLAAERCRSTPARTRRARAKSLRSRDRSAREEGIGRDERRAHDTRDRKKDVHTRAAEEQLRLALGTRVAIKRRGKRGVIEIAFTNEDELQRIYEYLTDRK